VVIGGRFSTGAADRDTRRTAIVTSPAPTRWSSNPGAGTDVRGEAYADLLHNARLPAETTAAMISELHRIRLCERVVATDATHRAGLDAALADYATYDNQPNPA
jgi:hypothetical protein